MVDIRMTREELSIVTRAIADEFIALGWRHPAQGPVQYARNGVMQHAKDASGHEHDAEGKFTGAGGSHERAKTAIDALAKMRDFKKQILEHHQAIKQQHGKAGEEHDTLTDKMGEANSDIVADAEPESGDQEHAKFGREYMKLDEAVSSYQQGEGETTKEKKT